MLKRRKLFSIESGSPRQGEKLSAGKAFFRIGTPAAVSGGVGAGILTSVPALLVGCLGGPGLTLFAASVTAASIYYGMSAALTQMFGWSFDKLTNIEDVVSNANISSVDLRTTGEQVKSGSPGITGYPHIIFTDSPIGHSKVDWNKDPKKYQVTFGIRGGVGVIILNNPSQGLLKDLNAGLVGMLNTDRRSDYVSQAIKGGYLINVKTSREGFALLISQAIRGGRKVNCVNTEVLNEALQSNQRTYSTTGSGPRELSSWDEKHPFAVFAIVEVKGGYAATTRAKDRGEEGKIGLPGGKVDPGEKPEVAVIREASEEGWSIKKVTGIAASRMVDGKPVVWYFATGATPLKDYPECYTDHGAGPKLPEPRVKPVVASKVDIANSGYGNDFIINL